MKIPTPIFFGDSMQDIVWITGVTVNLALVISFTLILVSIFNRRMLEDTKKRSLYLSVLCAILGMLLTNFGLFMVYIQYGLLQQIMTSSEILSPLLVQIGHHLTLLSFSLIIWILLPTEMGVVKPS